MGHSNERGGRKLTNQDLDGAQERRGAERGQRHPVQSAGGLKLGQAHWRLHVVSLGQDYRGQRGIDRRDYNIWEQACAHVESAGPSFVATP
jgi:hypothetical protein